ncbi:DUF948 domain-containing protein [Paenibacillus chondroitinus]|uniref:DUF948 domain-containing protein n=1 Tax=Paenibacillus chondroitinus TaxID=59842 RepID=A0ABU6D7A4_9BACL|nr:MULTISPECIES: DUF948 domain-containing protein [Paenibacillus]MCY9661917.1 DUF948 domain-containing protein [Paenibacillus anseongense]MEB4793603.1 DUF948 domain-containing protein [Paenibacillus chondroitinus]
MLVELSAVLAAIAFVFLVFYLIQTLKSLKLSLDQITLTMGQMKDEVTQISSEVQDVILNTNEMAIDVRAKLAKLNHLFSSVNDVGQVVHELTSSMKQSATGFIDAVKQTRLPKDTPSLSGRWQTILQGAAVSIEMWKKFKSKKTPHMGSMK